MKKKSKYRVIEMRNNSNEVSGYKIQIRSWFFGIWCDYDPFDGWISNLFKTKEDAEKAIEAWVTPNKVVYEK